MFGPPAVVKHVAEFRFGQVVSLLRRFIHPLGRSFGVWWNPFAGPIHQSQAIHRIGQSLVSSIGVQTRRWPRILVYTCSVLVMPTEQQGTEGGSALRRFPNPFCSFRIVGGIAPGRKHAAFGVAVGISGVSCFLVPLGRLPPVLGYALAHFVKLPQIVKRNRNSRVGSLAI